ncbi:hypothetical protein [Stratiformator vulcanicus]|uniref:Uncharacterized protein n=1 Tax=Stratiformator vulcanicus TaxID=2527980 RepID=A0A517R4M4_9PLAN|nr:hypothetical protein [Stratiformator vulcanicus]QDT38834.1 hypothetical protein Pan189_32330 [Stratiformator vulcanicus]
MSSSRELPKELKELVTSAVESIIGIDVPAPLGCHYRHNELRDEWEITLFAAKTEIIGGPDDGRNTASRFWLDLDQLRGIMTEVASFGWQAVEAGEGDEVGPNVAVIGQYQGYQVWLRILAEAPARYEAGRSADVLAAEFRNLW